LGVRKDVLAERYLAVYLLYGIYRGQEVKYTGRHQFTVTVSNMQQETKNEIRSLLWYGDGAGEL